MASCKECFHLEACIHLLETAYPKYKGKNIEFNATCEMFKNKADFVEVVRCEKCKFSHEDYFGQLWCRKKLREGTYVKDKNHFCRYGERKET